MGLKGSSLTLELPGQPVYDLEPALGDEFVLKRVKIIGLKFLVDENGRVTGFELYQPGGVYVAERIDD